MIKITVHEQDYMDVLKQWAYEKFKTVLPFGSADDVVLTQTTEAYRGTWKCGEYNHNDLKFLGYEITCKPSGGSE